MVRDLLIRGMLVGLFAGLLALAFARLVGEPEVDRAIAFEAHAAIAGEPVHSHMAMADAHDEELVSRGIQGSLGLATGVLVYGAAIGGLFALVFAYAHGRLGPLGPRATAALLAAAAFTVIFLVPALKYPPSPPAVGEADTIGYRSQLFFFLILCSITAATLALSLARPLVARFGAWNGVLLAAAVFVLVIGTVELLLPAIDEVPEGFPASVLWQFRLASAGIQLVLWTTIGLLFGALTERALAVRPA